MEIDTDVVRPDASEVNIDSTSPLPQVRFFPRTFRKGNLLPTQVTDATTLEEFLVGLVLPCRLPLVTLFLIFFRRHESSSPRGLNADDDAPAIYDGSKATSRNAPAHPWSANNGWSRSTGHAGLTGRSRETDKVGI